MNFPFFTTSHYHFLHFHKKVIKVANNKAIDQFIWGQTWNKSLMFRQGKGFWGGEAGY